MNHSVEQRHTSLAQRLWLLKRRFPPSPDADARHYFSAITILDRTLVRLLFVRSAVPQGAGEACLDDPGLRLRVERDARAFDSLDAALAWADTVRGTYFGRGWEEIPSDPNDH